MRKKFFTSKGLLLLAFFTLFTLGTNAQKSFVLLSPDGKLKTEISVGDEIQYRVLHENQLMLDNSPIALKLQGKTSFGAKSKLKNAKTKKVDEKIEAAVYKKRWVKNQYNELTLNFREGFQVVFRAFDDGVAYRFVTAINGAIVVENEQAVFNFPEEPELYIAYANKPASDTMEQQFSNSFENVYHHTKLSGWTDNHLAISPLLAKLSHGKKLAVLEADLISYPGMFLYKEGAKSMKGMFAPYPKRVEQGGHNQLQGLIKERETYIARYESGNVSFPWRVMVVASNDYELLNNDMVYRLAKANSGVANFDWVKPGKVAWDWWNDWNLYGVDFKAGINNETYQYYIDFASENGIEYVILDEGWSVHNAADLYRVVPELDLKKLVKYADERGVGLILWAGYYALNKDIEGLCKYYSDMGIKGFKVDFMDRDDQPMVDFHNKVAEIAAKHKLLIDFHGSYKPTGLHRTFPNVINFEGVFGLEQMKWDNETDMVTYDVTMPYIRMLAGPVDYTQGSMRNASKSNFRAVYNEAMSQGTRCRQLAEYVVFESPLNMLCDNPVNYKREPESTRFIAEIPTVWDETVALDGEVGKYISLARRKDATWYVGALTNWDSRELQIDLSFLPEGSFRAEVFKDGVNAARAAQDYKKELIDIPHDRKMTITMAPGGGFAMKIFPR